MQARCRVTLHVDTGHEDEVPAPRGSVLRKMQRHRCDRRPSRGYPATQLLHRSHRAGLSGYTVTDKEIRQTGVDPPTLGVRLHRPTLVQHGHGRHRPVRGVREDHAHAGNATCPVTPQVTVLRGVEAAIDPREPVEALRVTRHHMWSIWNHGPSWC